MCGQGNEYRSIVLANVHTNRTLTVPSLQAVFGSYRTKRPHASPRQPEGPRHHARSGRRTHSPSARRHPAGQHITSGPASPARRCQGRVDTETAKAAGRERRVRRVRPSRPARHSRRVADGDVEALVLLVDLAEEIDTAMAEAVKGLRARGYSWAEIGTRLGITRQAAQQRWGSF